MRFWFAIVALFSGTAAAAPRDFPFTWTSRTSAAGQNSLEAWLTPRAVRYEDYFRLDSRLAWVHGVTRTLESQLSMDLDFDSTLTQGLDPKASSLWRWTTWREGSTFAAGGLGRLSLGFDVFEVEARLFADWQLGRFQLALNASGARATFWNGRNGIDTRLEESGATRFAFSPHASFGLEVRAKSSWAQREYLGTAIYLGPTLTVTHGTFWVTLGGYAQVAADKANADRSLAEPNELRDNERFVLRLSLGFDT